MAGQIWVAGLWDRPLRKNFPLKPTPSHHVTDNDCRMRHWLQRSAWTLESEAQSFFMSLLLQWHRHKNAVGALYSLWGITGESTLQWAVRIVQINFSTTTLCIHYRQINSSMSINKDQEAAPLPSHPHVANQLQSTSNKRRWYSCIYLQTVINLYL